MKGASHPFFSQFIPSDKKGEKIIYMISMSELLTLKRDGIWGMIIETVCVFSSLDDEDENDVMIDV